MVFHGRKLNWSFDPLEALRRWPADRRILMLHSGRLHPRWARWSVLAEPVGTYRFFNEDGEGEGRSQWLTGRRPGSCPFNLTHKPFGDLKELRTAGGDSLWIGYISYDIARRIERLPNRAIDDRHWPLIEFGLCPGYLVYNALKKQWLACGTWPDNGDFPDLAALPAAYEQPYHTGLPRSIFEQRHYERAVLRVKDYISAGDVFQVNLTQRFTAEFSGRFPLSQRTLFGNLATASPAWYGAYLELAPDDDGRQRVIASTSPELFLEVDRDNNVTTRPIKGTRPAHVHTDELRFSEKDIAELNMIVDLMRNDLGRVCSYGTVRVIEPRCIETHPTVHHGVSTITGQLHKTKDPIHLLRATLPGGSVTGAPKIRAMQIIDELEPVRRGPYCGCIGYLGCDSLCMNMAIRTMMIETRRNTQTGHVDFSVGGGIIADSDPHHEYDETLDKAAAILHALRCGIAEAITAAGI